MPFPRTLAWWKPVPRDARRGLDLVRVVAALIILVHPVYALFHPAYLRAVGDGLAARGLPLAAPLVWATAVLQIACSAALLARRFVVPAGVVSFVLAGTSVILFRAPRWYVVGGGAEEGHPGAELDVLLMACLLATVWAHRVPAARAAAPSAEGDARSARPLDVVRIAAALQLLAHPLHAFLLWDVEGMRDWGHGMEARGFPFGVAMVWTIISVQAASSCALLIRRFVVPACAAHIAILGCGIWISHAPLWFVVGPGEGGMEYSVLLIACFAGVLWAYRPRSSGEGALGRLSPALLSVALLGACVPPRALPEHHAGPARPRDGNWVATWGASAQEADPDGPPLAIHAQTLRQIARVSLGGPRARVRLSNAYGTSPLRVGAAHLALHAAGPSIAPGSDRALTFDGSAGVTIAPGAVVVSDPVALAVPALGEVAVSLFLPDPVRVTTEHTFAQQTSYVSSPGDFSGAGTFAAAATTRSWHLVSSIEIDGPPRARAIIALGDSITDGVRSTPDASRRWTDLLATRLVAAARPWPRAVVNEGIAGNRVLGDLVGESALARLDRDVLAQAGAKFAVVLEGVNDLGYAPDDDVTAERLIAGYRAIVARAHGRGLTVLGATLTPFGGADFDSPEREARREAVNAWIRTPGSFDAHVDFDRAVRDPSRPARLAAAFDSGDHVHPGDAGYAAMAAAFDLSLFDGDDDSG